MIHDHDHDDAPSLQPSFKVWLCNQQTEAEPCFKQHAAAQ